MVCHCGLKPVRWRQWLSKHTYFTHWLLDIKQNETEYTNFNSIVCATKSVLVHFYVVFVGVYFFPFHFIFFFLLLLLLLLEYKLIFPVQYIEVLCELDKVMVLSSHDWVGKFFRWKIQQQRISKPMHTITRTHILNSTSIFTHWNFKTWINFMCIWMLFVCHWRSILYVVCCYFLSQILHQLCLCLCKCISIHLYSSLALSRSLCAFGCIFVRRL